MNEALDGVDIWHVVAGAIRVQRRLNWMSDDRAVSVYVVQQAWSNQNGEIRWEDVPLVDESENAEEWPRP